MRIIKFRALGFEGSWHYGFVAKGNESAVINPINKDGSVSMDINIYVKPETIGQYIGLRDINGKEVYEGDIVRLHRNGKYTYVVKWREGCAEFVGRCRETGLGLANLNENREIEVIGNIYED